MMDARLMFKLPYGALCVSVSTVVVRGYILKGGDICSQVRLPEISVFAYPTDFVWPHRPPYLTSKRYILAYFHVEKNFTE